MYSLRELRLFRNKPQYCGDKPIYDKRQAETAKNRRWNQDHIRLRIYHCPNCNYWHLTSKLANARLYPKKR